MLTSQVNLSTTKNGAQDRTIFKQTFKFARTIYKQKITPDGFLIRDCGCVMRFLPSPDYNLNKTKSHSTNVKILKNIRNPGKSKEQTRILDRKDMKKPHSIQQASSFQSTFWMEPRAVPVKYTSTVNICLDSPIKRFMERIDLQMKLVPCQYVEQVGSIARFKTSIETQINSECTIQLDSN
ncbi:uncharacterized protein LOC126841557 [Adelges cooleyi]|uniref:uncharacterized protein LOC126841557 n=1 Tax=Adelges cooleyi TaxID=133065 RepID=UPI00217F9B97|nr:uncharacterized protein LOC126841557 [Adelges cooleyi]XP_050434098.1 uncharacterized protein LOC126841557 [Adelges cooleyi]XP_050434106.1 uncharacterized protein LOC126841557 [Adelges cooleyi]